VKLLAAMPLNLTAMTLDKFVPVRVILTPIGPEAGENEVIVGAGMKMYEDVEVAVPPGVVTVILPEVVFGAKAVMEVALITVKLIASVPLNFTDVVPVKLVPVIVTFTPIGTEVGVNDVILGGNGISSSLIVTVVDIRLPRLAPLTSLRVMANVLLFL